MGDRVASDVSKRIAAPMAGGILSSFIIELVVQPAIYKIWKRHSEVTPRAAPAGVATPETDLVPGAQT